MQFWIQWSSKYALYYCICYSLTGQVNDTQTQTHTNKLIISNLKNERKFQQNKDLKFFSVFFSRKYICTTIESLWIFQFELMNGMHCTQISSLIFFPLQIFFCFVNCTTGHKSYLLNWILRLCLFLNIYDHCGIIRLVRMDLVMHHVM